MTAVIVNDDDYCTCDEPDPEFEAAQHTSGWNLPPGGIYEQGGWFDQNCGKPMPPDYGDDDIY